MVDDSASSDVSSSYDESESSSDLANDREWTCDDIYPTKEGKALGSDSDDDSSSEEEADGDSSSSDDSFASPKKATQKSTLDTSDNSDSSENSDTSASVEVNVPKPFEPRTRPPLRKHSSGEIEVTLNAQSDALKNAKDEEDMRRAQLTSSRHEFEERNMQVQDMSQHMNDEYEALSKEYDSSDDAIKAIEQKLEEKRNGGDAKARRSEEKAKFEKRNMEREMRLAKARERIEKKKDDEAAKAEQERLKEKEGYGKLDMSKSARVERAYSWYSRMAMPTREKMKERVEFMPASSGVTPDDVDLLPWNARGTFVSVAAMMRMNRTAANSGSAAISSGSGAGSDSDSD
jgi:hypothetical protein